MGSKRGLFITFEGGEAVGKSTQIDLLKKALVRQRFNVFVTREPGGTKLGEVLRTMVKTHPMSERAELLLFEASRAEHVFTELKPRLQRGEIILCDRYEESSVVYQGISRGIPMKEVLLANKIATGGLRSDFIVLLDGKLARARLHARGVSDRIEREAETFHKKVARGYRKLAKSDRRFHVYPADLDRKTIHEMILKDILKLLRKR